MKEQPAQNNEYWFNLIIDDLTNRIEEDEKRLLIKWIESSDQHAIQYKEYKKIWEISLAGNTLPDFDQEKGYIHFRSRTSTNNVFPLASSCKKRRYSYITIAAAVFIPLLILSNIVTFYYRNVEEVPVEINTWSTLIVPKGSMSQMELPDGTQVWINAGSTLQYTGSFGKTDRNIRLSGEAYFEVTSNQELPLIIESGPVQVEVLGTKFNVSAYEQLPAIKVALLEGSVCLHDPHTMYQLSPGEMGVYDLNSRQTDIIPYKPELTYGWMKGQLIFDGEIFEEIVFRLEQHFNVTIQIENKELLKRHFKGDFINNETLEETLHIMSSLRKFKYEITGNHVKIF